MDPSPKSLQPLPWTPLREAVTAFPELWSDEQIAPFLRIDLGPRVVVATFNRSTAFFTLQVEGGIDPVAWFLWHEITPEAGVIHVFEPTRAWLLRFMKRALEGHAEGGWMRLRGRLDSVTSEPFILAPDQCGHLTILDWERGIGEFDSGETIYALQAARGVDLEFSHEPDDGTDAKVRAQRTARKANAILDAARGPYDRGELANRSRKEQRQLVSPHLPEGLDVSESHFNRAMVELEKAPLKGPRAKPNQPS
jgi:hypothetical protein